MAAPPDDMADEKTAPNPTAGGLDGGALTESGGASPFEAEITRWADHYFLRTKQAVRRFGDKEQTRTD